MMMKAKILDLIMALLERVFPPEYPVHPPRQMTEGLGFARRALHARCPGGYIPADLVPVSESITLANRWIHRVWNEDPKLAARLWDEVQ